MTEELQGSEDEEGKKGEEWEVINIVQKRVYKDLSPMFALPGSLIFLSCHSYITDQDKLFTVLYSLHL